MTNLISFEDIPYGGRFRYPDGERVYVVLWKERKREGGPLHGTIADWHPDMMKPGYSSRQMFFGHIPEADGGDCPEMVIPVD